MSHDKSPIIPEAVRTAIEHSLEQDAELLTRSVQQLIQIRSVSEEPREGSPMGGVPQQLLTGLWPSPGNSDSLQQTLITGLDTRNTDPVTTM